MFFVYHRTFNRRRGDFSLFRMVGVGGDWWDSHFNDWNNCTSQLKMHHEANRMEVNK